MARIRVDTEELRKSAKEIAASADAVGKAGDEILAVAASLPSYDGQLSGPARRAGYEIQSRMRDLKTALAGDADALNRAAQAFEEVDTRTVRSLAENQEALLISSLPPIREGGNPDYLAYKDFGDYVIFWKNGEPIKIYKTEENISMILQFEKDVDDWAKYLAKALIIADKLTQGIFGDTKIACVLVIIVLLGYVSAELFPVIAAKLGASEAAIASAKAAIEAISKGVDIASGAGSFALPDILKHFGVETVDPWEYQQDIKDIQGYMELSNTAWEDAVKEWDALAPPTPPTQTPIPSGPTPVPAPTPPMPTPTPTQPPP
jgi:uncharacterized protein YukE